MIIYYETLRLIILIMAKIWKKNLRETIIEYIIDTKRFLVLVSGLN